MMALAPRLVFDPSPAYTNFQLLAGGTPLPYDSWALEAPASLAGGITLLRRLVAEDKALEDAASVEVTSIAVADLGPGEARLLHLPPLADAAAVLRMSGTIGRPDHRVVLEWQRATGQPIIGAQRIGAWLLIAGSPHRLPRALFDISEAVDGFAVAEGGDQAARFAALRRLTEALPEAARQGMARGQAALGTIRILEADAFSLDFAGDAMDPQLVPVLHRAGVGDAPLLDEAMHDAFARQQFATFPEVRGVYTPASGCFLVLAPALRRALGVVRQAQGAPAGRRRALLANPRAALRTALAETLDDAVLEDVFRDTPTYAERVRGLGLWMPRVVPWLTLPGSDWFGPETGGVGSGKAAPGAAGLMVGEQRVTLAPDEARDLAARIEAAIAAGMPSVQVRAGDTSVEVPATSDTLAKLNALERARAKQETGGARPADPAGTDQGPQVLLIAPNLDTLEIEARCQARGGPDGAQVGLATALKPHQREGLDWLIKAWRAGEPGVLLADDMGLGKTLQALAFLAWVRAGMSAGVVPRAPVLVVAPTSLLDNWRAEHDRHLAAPGLGVCLAAYGRGLATLQSALPDDPSALDIARIAAADWVLTTYETLRDHDRHFGQVRFAAAFFDEAQRIKSPDARMTDAAKAMNADFRVAMTGTPVENRLSDLWCIVDGLHPGALGDLRGFSARYEAPDADPARRAALKATLDQPRGGRPALLLRRLKEDRLPELPGLTELVTSAAMPEAQHDAYRAAIDEARGQQRPGAMLKALLALRAISLLPGPTDGLPDRDVIDRSARLGLCFATLDGIAAAGDRVLIFLDDLDVMAWLAGAIQRRYRMPAAPMVINGTVLPRQRQPRVDRFQNAPDDFDAMLLSPRAAGVGLTLTRATHVIHLSRWWNPAVEDQCTARALRIGQTRPVMVHIPMAVLPGGGASFDQNLHALLGRKRQLMREMLAPAAPGPAEEAQLFASTMDGAG